MKLTVSKSKASQEAQSETLHSVFTEKLSYSPFFS